MPSNRPSRQPLPGLKPQVKLPAAPLTAKPKGNVPLKNNPATPDGKAGSSQPFTGRLDMKSWDRDPVEIYALLYKKEFDTDEYSGLV